MKAGDKVGKLTAIEFTRKDETHHKFWMFQCDCGTKKEIRYFQVKRGQIKSCGCLSKENREQGRNIKHGLCNTPIYNSWISMKQMCNNPTHRGYHNHGAIGIKYPKRWKDIKNFLADMGPREKGMVLTRLDNTKDFSKKNCVWMNERENARYSRTKRREIEWQGKMIPLWELSDMYPKINKDVLMARYRKGLRNQDIVSGKSITKPRKSGEYYGTEINQIGIKDLLVDSKLSASSMWRLLKDEGLDDREARIIIHRLGIGTGIRKTLAQVAELEGLTSRERIRQIEEKALSKLEEKLI